MPLDDIPEIYFLREKPSDILQPIQEKDDRIAVGNQDPQGWPIPVPFFNIVPKMF